MELFEAIRRDYVHGSGTIQGVSRKLGVHRRMVRQALVSAIRRSESSQFGAIRVWGR